MSVPRHTDVTNVLTLAMVLFSRMIQIKGLFICVVVLSLLSLITNDESSIPVDLQPRLAFGFLWKETMNMILFMLGLKSMISHHLHAQPIAFLCFLQARSLQKQLLTLVNIQLLLSMGIAAQQPSVDEKYPHSTQLSLRSH